MITATTRYAGFLAGTAAVDITPTRSEIDEHSPDVTGQPLYPEGAAAPLWAKALATRDPDRTIILITGDLIMTSKWIADAVRDELGERFRVPREAIAICTSQTHSGVFSAWRDLAYNRRLIRALVEAGANAMAGLRPAKIGVGNGWNYAVAYNTRLPITDELPSGVCPDLDRHKGGCMLARHHCLGRSGGRPMDHEVGVIRIDDADDKPLAIVYHYNCHPATVISGPSMHGDFSGFASTAIEENCPGAMVFFLQGSLANSHPRYFFTDVDRARENGRDIAREVIRVLPAIETTGKVRLGVASRPFALTMTAYPLERIKRLLGYYKNFLAELDRDPQASWVGAGADTINLPPRFDAGARRNMVTPLIAYCELKLSNRWMDFHRGFVEEELPPWECETQVFMWNDIALCLHNWEMFIQTGLEIKRLSPSRYTFPVGNTNWLVGYVAPQDEFDIGGYEVVTNPMYGGARKGMWAPENTGRIVKQFTAMVGDLCRP